MRYFSTFTGAGGFEQGLPEDWECVGFSEIDKYANMVLKYHYPNIKNYGDINAIDWNKIPNFDLLVGGSPCQDLSMAGRRKGLAGERSGLFFAFTKALRDKLPDYFIWENVKGALSSNEGWDFAEVLNSFSELGYSLWWQILNAKDFGVPQNRERIFVIGFKARLPPQISIKSKKIRGNLQMEFTRESFETIGALPARGGGEYHRAMKLIYMIPSATKKGYEIAQEGDGLRLSHIGSKTLMKPSWTKDNSYEAQALGLGDAYTIQEGHIRRIMPIECERLMSWSDDWTKYGLDEQNNKIEIKDRERYRMCGNGVVSNVVKEIVRELMP